MGLPLACSVEELGRDISRRLGCVGIVLLATATQVPGRSDLSSDRDPDGMIGTSQTIICHGVFGLGGLLLR